MLQVDRINPLHLTGADITHWRRFLDAQPALASPYLTPEWAQAVARRRTDAEVAIFRRDDRIVGFLPVQRPNDYAALPIGGPVCDYQGLIGPAEPMFDLAEAARALNVGRIDFSCGLMESGIGRHLHRSDKGYVARFNAGWDAYVAERKAAGSDGVASTLRTLRKLARDHGDVRFESFSSDAAALDRLIGWKRAQMKSAGVAAIFEHGWISGLVRDTLVAPRTRTFGGALFVLRVKGVPVAGLYCLSSRATLHAWISACDPDFAADAPELCTILSAMRAAESAGYTEMDFGTGASREKECLSNSSRPVGAGFVGRPSVATALRAAEYSVRALVEHLPVGRVREWPGKAMRRQDIQAGLVARDVA